MDLAYSSDSKCINFFRTSQPLQSRPPVTAYRWAFRNTMKQAIKAGSVMSRVRGVSIKCNTPAPKYNSDLKRIILTARLSAMTFEDLVTVIAEYRNAESEGTFTDLVLAKGGPDFAFPPIYFNYNNKNRFPICTVGFKGCSPFPWNPTQITIFTPSPQPER